MMCNMATRVPLPVLRNALHAMAESVKDCNADVWILALTSVFDQHGYRLEILKDR
jgi:hypothetical protein